MTHREKQMPERRCIYTRETSSREMLVRFAVSPDGIVVPDLEEKLPGRGLWLTARGDIIRRACAENAFSKAARRNVIEASDGADDGREKLARRATGVETLSLWTADRLGAPFGRDKVVHAAIFAGGLADRLSREALRCAGIQSEGIDIDAQLELQES